MSTSLLLYHYDECLYAECRGAEKCYFCRIAQAKASVATVVAKQCEKIRRYFPVGLLFLEHILKTRFDVLIKTFKHLGVDVLDFQFEL